MLDENVALSLALLLWN